MPSIVKKPRPEDLEARVKMLLEGNDRVRALIVAHEFDQARRETEALAFYCGGANTMANRLADQP